MRVGWTKAKLDRNPMLAMQSYKIMSSIMVLSLITFTQKMMIKLTGRTMMMAATRGYVATISGKS